MTNILFKRKTILQLLLTTALIVHAFSFTAIPDSFNPIRFKAKTEIPVCKSGAEKSIAFYWLVRTNSYKTEPDFLLNQLCAWRVIEIKLKQSPGRFASQPRITFQAAKILSTSDEEFLHS